MTRLPFRARWAFLLALACFCAPGSAQPLLVHESRSKAKKEAFCVPPTHQPATDAFEFVLHTRNLSLLELAQVAEPQILNRTYLETLRRVFAQPSLLSRQQVQSGVVNAGHQRMERFICKLVEGKPVTVVVLGGSISFGHGVRNHENSWPSRVFKWIQETFPHKEHQLLNHAIPAITSGFIAPCAYTMIPDGTDLVMAEFTLNDGADDMTRTNLARFYGKQACSNDMEGPGRQAVERLVRQILTGPSKPALMYMHTWAGNRPKPVYYDGVEDRYTTLMSYYGVATLSLRNALNELVQRSEGLKARVWPNERDFHLTCVGTKFLADLVTGYLGEQAADAAARLYGQQLQEQVGIDYSDAQTWELPPPMFEGNDGRYTADCILDDRIQRYVTNAQGFHWVNEGLPTDPKWGYVATTAGSQMAIKVPLANVTHNGTDMLVGIGLLLSGHGHMGVAQLGCLAGCVCPMREYSTFLKQASWSMTFWRFLEAKFVPGSEECVVGVVTSQRTHSAGHKIKVSSVMATGELGSRFGGNSLIESTIVDVPGAPPGAAMTRHRSMAEVHIDLEGITVGTRSPRRLNLTQLHESGTGLFSMT